MVAEIKQGGQQDMATFTGKTVAEAIENGLVTLKVTKNEANIKVINAPKTGLFGRVRKEAEVEIVPIGSQYHLIGEEQSADEAPNLESTNTVNENETMSDDQVRSMLISSLSHATAEYVKDLAAKRDIIVSYEIKTTANQFLIDLSTTNESQLIGTRGTTINELQEQANQFVQQAKLDDIDVVLDTKDYRAKRSEILKKVAERAAKEVANSEESVYFDPMPEFERVQIHGFLKDNKKVRSYSEGKGKQRVVVVAPRTKLSD